MAEESPQSFPRQNDVELLCGSIKSELEKARITLQWINKDLRNNTCTVTTDEEVPEEIKSNICHDAACKGITIKFLTSG